MLKYILRPPAPRGLREAGSVRQGAGGGPPSGHGRLAEPTRARGSPTCPGGESTISESHQPDLERYLHSLQSIARTVNSNMDLNSILDTVVATVCEQSPWPMVCIARVDPQRQEVSFVAEHGFVRAGLGYTMTWPVSVSLTPVALETGKPLIIDDALELKEYPAILEGARARGYRSVMVVPMRLEGQPTAMWFCTPWVRKVSSAEVAFAAAIAEQAAIAIHQAQLLRRQRDDAEKLKQATDVVAKKNQTLERIISTHISLAQMVLDDSGLTRIATAVADQINNPFIVEDRIFRPLFSYWGPDEPGFPPGRSVLSPDVRAQVLPLLRDQRSVILKPTEELGLPWRFLIAPIVAGRETLGYIYVPEVRRAFEDVDTIIAEQAALVLALEIIKQQTRSRVERELRTDFLRDLLSGEHTSADELRRRAALARLDLSRPTTLLLVSPSSVPDARVFPTLLETISQSLARTHPGSFAALQGENVVVLVPEQADPNAFAGALRKQIQRDLPELKLLLGIGDTCGDIPGYPRAYREARKALSVLRFLGRSEGVMAYADLGIYGVLFRDQEGPELADFARRTIGALVAYDQERDMQLLRTLEAFLLNNGHLQRTTRQLFIHMTTLRYRLRRIEEILRVDLDSAETRFNLQLALKIHRWHGSSPAAVNSP